MRDARCEMRDARYEMRDARCEMRVIVGTVLHRAIQKECARNKFHAYIKRRRHACLARLTFNTKPENH